MARKSIEANRAYYRKYYVEHKEEIRNKQSRYVEKFPRIHVPDSSREIRLKYHYKITVEEYEKKLVEQGSHCALCDRTQGENQRRMAVDHNHTCCPNHKACGKCNRGILCADCNRKIGFLEAVLKEGTIVPKIGTWLSKALDYVIRYQQQSSALTCAVK